MQEILLDIRQRLINKEYKNEEHVRLSLVARVVQQLGWDIWNPTEVFTEFKAAKKEDNTRVDMALFTHGFDATAIFIECKGVGNFAADLTAVERQLRDYNRDHTALFTIITDGRHWRFYFSFTSGEFKDKLFCKFDVQQDSLEEIAAYLETFLLRDNIVNHSARQRAEAYLMLGKKERAMQDVLPDAQKMALLPPWSPLPEVMVQLLAARVLVVTPAEAQAFLAGSTRAAMGALPAGADGPAQPGSAAATASENKAPAAPKRAYLKKGKDLTGAPPPPLPTVAEAAPAFANAKKPAVSAAEELFVLKQGAAHAKAFLQADGQLRVVAGSVAAGQATVSLSASGLAVRNALIASGVLQTQGEQLVFVTDQVFVSANRAAEVVVARSVNGQTAWQHSTGKQVRDFTAQQPKL